MFKCQRKIYIHRIKRKKLYCEIMRVGYWCCILPFLVWHPPPKKKWLYRISPHAWKADYIVRISSIYSQIITTEGPLLALFCVVIISLKHGKTFYNNEACPLHNSIQPLFHFYIRYYFFYRTKRIFN